eukprot:m.239027 g.239027  ORF g.239027 m.239027 type:complete len:250 (+) comp17432_c1_seq13:3314-4063(+)
MEIRSACHVVWYHYPGLGAVAFTRGDLLHVCQVEPLRTVKRRDGSGDVALASVTLVDNHHCCRSLTLWGMRTGWIEYLATGHLALVTHLRVRQYKDSLIASTTAWSKLLSCSSDSSLNSITDSQVQAGLRSLQPRARSYKHTASPVRPRSTNARPLRSLAELLAVDQTGLFQIECQLSLPPIGADNVIIGCSRCGQSLEEPQGIAICSCGERYCATLPKPFILNQFSCLEPICFIICQRHNLNGASKGL